MLLNLWVLGLFLDSKLIFLMHLGGLEIKIGAFRVFELKKEKKENDFEELLSVF
jgi:hypothetical protein